MQNKKQLYNLFVDIAKLNNDAWDNKPGTYDSNNAAALVIEEALEKLTLSDKLANQLGCGNTPKELARHIVSLTTGVNVDRSLNADVPPVGALDSSLDVIYIEVGNLHMLGLSPAQMVEGLAVVHTANLQKSGAKDANGKVTKSTDFVNPEPLLQIILDNRA